jgi:D-lactate dehydrogenase
MPACGILPSYCVRSTAEQALTSALLLRRRLPRAAAAMEGFDKTHPADDQPQLLAGANVLIVGCGRIGSLAVDLFRSLGAVVMAVDPVENAELGIEYVPLAVGVLWATVIVVAADLNPTSLHLLTPDSLATAQPNVIIVNVARGAIAPLPGLVQMLLDGAIGGLATDVFEFECEISTALHTHNSIRGWAGAGCPSTGCEGADLELAAIARVLHDDRVLLTPHVAQDSALALSNKVRGTIDGVRALLDGRTAAHVPQLD